LELGQYENITADDQVLGTRPTWELRLSRLFSRLSPIEILAPEDGYLRLSVVPGLCDVRLFQQHVVDVDAVHDLDRLPGVR
jgi:hypothetical protein